MNLKMINKISIENLSFLRSIENLSFLNENESRFDFVEQIWWLNVVKINLLSNSRDFQSFIKNLTFVTIFNSILDFLVIILCFSIEIYEKKDVDWDVAETWNLNFIWPLGNLQRILRKVSMKIDKRFEENKKKRWIERTRKLTNLPVN